MAKAPTAADVKKSEAALTLARGRFNAIKERFEEREIAPKRRALVGKCFRYRNCYSCPEKPSDYWWMWTRITGVDGGCLTCVQAQCDKHGKITIENGSLPCFQGNIDDHYLPVTQMRFNLAVKYMLAKANKLAFAPSPTPGGGDEP